MGQFLHKFKIFGDTHASKIWVIIHVYHEYASLRTLIAGIHEPIISAFIFADTLEEAEHILNTLVYEHIKKDSGEEEEEEEEEEDEDESNRTFIYLNDNRGSVGNIGLVPEKWYPLIRKVLT